MFRNVVGRLLKVKKLFGHAVVRQEEATSSASSQEHAPRLEDFHDAELGNNNETAAQKKLETVAAEIKLLISCGLLLAGLKTCILGISCLTLPIVVLINPTKVPLACCFHFFCLSYVIHRTDPFTRSIDRATSHSGLTMNQFCLAQGALIWKALARTTPKATLLFLIDPERIFPHIASTANDMIPHDTRARFVTDVAVPCFRNKSVAVLCAALTIVILGTSHIGKVGEFEESALTICVFVLTISSVWAIVAVDRMIVQAYCAFLPPTHVPMALQKRLLTMVTASLESLNFVAHSFQIIFTMFAPTMCCIIFDNTNR